jgi:ribosomal protein S12 methylthiotransferase accessory factor
VSDVVAVIGKGRLADLVYGKLSILYKVIRRKDLKSGVPKRAKLCLVLSDEYRPLEYLAAEKELQREGKPWLSGFILFDEGVVGPLVRPGIPGCSQCADMRRLAAGSDRENSMEQQMSLFKYGVIQADHSISNSGLLQMSCLILAEVQTMLQDNGACTEGGIYVVDLKTLTSTLHTFLPDPLCRVCARLEEDLPETARISLQPRPKINAETYRCKSMDKLANGLVRDYRDDRTGLINRKSWDPSSPFCDVQVSLPSWAGNEWTAGRSHSYQESEPIAILEGLERYCGMLPRGKQTKVYDSYRNLQDQALDPVSVGLYSEEQYALPDFPFEPFDSEARMNWVWGYSISQERPILVPQELAYYGTAVGGRFVTEGSNGCALGGSLEEAILYGMMEIVERDAFLLTWYAKLPLARLDPETAHDTELLLMINRMQAVAGYDLFLFNSTMENGIPSIWVTAKNRKNTGANLICAAGAHLDPIRAAKSAIFELAAHTGYLDDMFETRREEFGQMLEDPDLVSEMQDHAFLYTTPEAEERLQFLLEPNRPLRTFAEEFGKRTPHLDLTEDLKTMLQEFRRLQLDVVVVNQTTPEVLRNGLQCVKVIIPGMLPMTFGHQLKRLTGLDRLRRVPRELGFSTRLLTNEDFNPYPHPFL